jgi:hypothetical protein
LQGIGGRPCAALSAQVHARGMHRTDSAALHVLRMPRLSAAVGNSARGARL